MHVYYSNIMAIFNSKMNLLVYLVVLLQFWFGWCSNVVVIPPVNQLVPQTSTENVSYLCNISSATAGGEAVWAVQGRQVPDDVARRMEYAVLGVFINFLVPGVTELVADSNARDLFGGNIAVQCIGTVPGSPPTTVSGDMLSIITYGRPGAPTTLSLDPASSNDLDELVFSWQPPSGGLEGVDIVYHLTVTGLSINLVNITELTSVTFLDQASRDCRQHTFIVAAENEAGLGPSSFINRTIPIAPDLTQLDKGFNISTVFLTNPIRLSLIIPLATTCSQEFEILSYTLMSSDPDLFSPLQLGNGSSLEVALVVAVPGLPQDVMLDIFIEVCISLTCKNSSRRVPLRTSSTQNASLVYFENNVQMSCVFASNSDSPGCRFILTVGNVSELFDLLRATVDSTSVTQCNQTMNQGEVYGTITVVDIQRTGENGGLALQFMASSLPNSSSYIETTSCSIPSPPTALSTGAIVGIVLAALVIGVALLVVVVILAIYCYKIQPLGIDEEEDEERLTLNLKKNLLFDVDAKLRKEKKPLMVSIPGHNSPDMQLLGEIVVPSSPSPTAIKESDVQVELTAGSSATAPPAVARFSDNVDVSGDGAIVVGRQEEAARSSATAPLLSSPESQHAFTLDISSDRTKVKLHLNRALIRQKLKENKMNTRNIKKGHQLDRQMSYCKLPMTCEMRVQALEKK